MADQQADAFSHYPEPLQYELRAIDETSKDRRYRTEFLQKLFKAVVDNDQKAAEIVLGCLRGRFQSRSVIGEAKFNCAMLFIRPVASTVSLLLPTVDETFKVLSDAGFPEPKDTELVERLRVLEGHDSSAFRSAHDAIRGFSGPITTALIACGMAEGETDFLRTLKDWEGELSPRQWTVFKKATETIAQNDVATLLKTLDIEHADAMARARAGFYGGIRDVSETVIDEVDQYVGEPADPADDDKGVSLFDVAFAFEADEKLAKQSLKQWIDRKLIRAAPIGKCPDDGRRQLYGLSEILADTRKILCLTYREVGKLRKALMSRLRSPRQE